MPPLLEEAILELVLVLVLLWIGQGLLLALSEANASLAATGALIFGLLELFALWFYRRTLPQQAATSIRYIPKTGVLLRWSVFAVIAGGLIQVASIGFAPAEDLSFRPMTTHWAGWIFVVLIGPLVEEILFRACVFELLRPKFSVAIALVSSAALFGLGHGSLVSMAFAFCGGLMFSFAYLRSGSILPGFIGHAVVNAIGLWAIRNGAV